jgi:hypothetical protein
MFSDLVADLVSFHGRLVTFGEKMHLSQKDPIELLEISKLRKRGNEKTYIILQYPQI